MKNKRKKTENYQDIKIFFIKLISVFTDLLNFIWRQYEKAFLLTYLLIANLPMQAQLNPWVQTYNGQYWANMWSVGQVSINSSTITGGTPTEKL